MPPQLGIVRTLIPITIDLFFRGCGSVAEWVRAYPLDAAKMFRACSVASSNIQRRQRDVLRRPGIQVLAMGDPDMPSRLSLNIAMQVASTPLCDLKPGFERRFRQRHETKSFSGAQLEVHGNHSSISRSRFNFSIQCY